jgi:hypothetical protein
MKRQLGTKDCVHAKQSHGRTHQASHVGQPCVQAPNPSHRLTENCVAGRASALLLHSSTLGRCAALFRAVYTGQAHEKASVRIFRASWDGNDPCNVSQFGKIARVAR